MISLRTALRTMPAFWLAVPLFVLSGAYMLLLAPSDGYAMDASAKGTTTLGFAGPFVAACAAWEASRLRRGRVWAAPSVRSRLVIGFWAVLPVMLVGLVAVTIAIGVQLARSGAGLPDVRFIAVSALDLAAFGAFGFALGVLLPIAVAVPACIVLPFIWLAFLPAMEPVWMRHLTGMFRDCCGLDRELAIRAVAASALVNVGIIGSSVLLVSGPPGFLRRVVVPAAPFALSLIAGVVLVNAMTYSPTVARDPELLNCSTTDEVTVCIWPEHERRAEEVAAIVGDVRAAWQAAGIDVPSLFTEADPAIMPPDALGFNFNGALSKREDIVNSLAYGMTPLFPDCPGGSQGAIVLEYLHAWYAAAGGVSDAKLEAEFGYTQGEPYPEILDAVADLQAAAPDVRREWTERAERLSQLCEGLPIDQIAVAP